MILPRSRTARLLLLAASALVLLAGIGALALRSLLDPEHVRQAVAAQASAALGQKVTLAGARLRVYPRVTLELAGLTEHKTEYVAWGWAVNGFASVVGSVLSTMLAMTFGFHVVMIVAFCIYVVAVATLWGLLPSARSAGAEAGAVAQS